MSNYRSKIVTNSRWHLDWPLLFAVLLLLLYSFFILYSASGQDLRLINHKCFQMILGLLALLTLAQIPPRIYAAWSPYLYVASLLSLLLVTYCGYSAKGAQRWLDIGIIRFQPSELAKLTVPLLIAHFISYDSCPPTLKKTVIALALILIPTVLVALQPDLGTALLIAISGFFILFLAGISWRLIGVSSALVILLIPNLWYFLMHDYQRNRVLSLFNPERDPLGSGYHIIQSKIAIGSGGLFGKGWLQGTQSQLEFLPERHTDFIFAVLAEELGLVGVVLLLALYLYITLRGLMLSSKAQTAFAHLIIGSYSLMFFFYLWINIGMVSGLLPVVGIPLPLVSYGGSSLLVLMASFGIIMALHTHRKLLSKSV